MLEGRRNPTFYIPWNYPTSRLLILPKYSKLITNFHTIIAPGTISISAPNTEKHAIVTLFACHSVEKHIHFRKYTIDEKLNPKPTAHVGTKLKISV